MKFFNSNEWALILVGSSGFFRLASAKKLVLAGMNLFIVHCDRRRGAMVKINQSFNEIRSYGTQFWSCNMDGIE